MKKIVFKDPNFQNKVMLTLEKKTFDLEGQREFFLDNENQEWVFNLLQCFSNPTLELFFFFLAFKS